MLASSICGPNDVAIRLDPAVIDQLTEDQAKRILSHNEAVAAKGCAVPNQ